MITLKNVSKKYIISHEKQALVRNILPQFLRAKKLQEFYALRNIDLRVGSGESLGIIGRNGSGKSTLLNIISGITIPEEGVVKVTGRVSSMLTLGAGFHPELTGEENVYLNATLLGLPIRKIRHLLPDIVDFSQLQDFIDAPLRTYSVGMLMRLGFAIIAHTQFNILLIDEVFSVGDIAFQKKCLEKMNEFKQQGVTIILVSQSLGLIKEFCDSALLLEAGTMVCQGPPAHVVARHEEVMSSNQQVGRSPCKATSLVAKQREAISQVPFEEFDVHRGNNAPATIIDFSLHDKRAEKITHYADITKVCFFDARNIEKAVFQTGERMKIAVDYEVKQRIADPHFGVAIFRDNGIYCFGPNTRFDKINIPELKIGKGSFSIDYESLNLLPGIYLVSVAIWAKDETFAHAYHYLRYSFEVISEKEDHGLLFLKHAWSFRQP